MQPLHDSVRRVEDRLERMLAGGWRNAGADAADLAAEAAALEEAGLTHLATALRAVVATAAPATGPAAALSAVTLAAAHCRLLRARLATDQPPSGSWAPLAPAARRKPAAGARLLPVARLAHAGGEAWACVGIRGLYPDGLTLVAPPDGAPASPWFQQTLQGRQRWLGRYPLGASGSVEAVAVHLPEWAGDHPEEGQEDPLAPFLAAWDKGSLKENQPVFRYGGALQVKSLQPDDLDTCVWPDPAVAPLLRQAMNGGPAWTLTWTEGALMVPLAVLRPGGRFWGKPRLVHLVPGLPEEHPIK
jgi:hypothetical protein